MKFEYLEHFSGDDRKLLKMIYHRGKGRISSRAHIILLIASICVRYSVTQIAAICHCSRKTVYNTIERFNSDGLLGLFDQKRSGCPLDIPETAETAALLEKLKTQTPQDLDISLHRRWTLALIGKLLHRELGISTSTRTISGWLRRNGWSYHRAKRELLPPGPLSAADQRQVVSLLNCPEVTQDVLLFLDESGFYLDGIVAGCWMPEGKQKKIPTKGNRRKVWVFGAFNPHTKQVHHRFAETCNADGVILFLQDLQHMYPDVRIHIVLDNASFHKKSQKVKDFVNAQPNLVLHFLPARAPKLNPIERVWLYAKNVVVACAVYQNLAELKNQIVLFFQQFNSGQIKYNFNRQKVIKSWENWPTESPKEDQKVNV